MQDHFLLESHWKKILDLGWSVLPQLAYSSDLVTSDFHLFYSLQNALNNNKFSQEDQVKTSVKNFLSLIQAEFYLRRISKLPYKWQEAIQNYSKYTIDWNEYIVRLFMNKFYFTKTNYLWLKPVVTLNYIFVSRYHLKVNAYDHKERVLLSVFLIF